MVDEGLKSGKPKRSRRRRNKKSAMGANPKARPFKDSGIQIDSVKARRPLVFEAELAFDLFPVFGSVPTNTVEVLPLFRPDDFTVINKENYEWSSWEGLYGNALGKSYPTFPAFKITSSQAIERLNILGVTLEEAKAGFVRAQAKKLAAFEIPKGKSYHRLRGPGATGNTPAPNTKPSILKNITAEFWQEQFKELFLKGVCRRSEIRRVKREEQELVTQLLLDTEDPYGGPVENQLQALRLALEVVRPEEPLFLICFFHWSRNGKELYEDIEKQLIADSDKFNKTIILTEGTTDSEILNTAMEVIRPNISPFFHFMEFDQLQLQGGAGQLVNIIKAFAAADIRNKVIGLFDNDTAGHKSLSSLLRFELPPNFKAISLPDIEIAENYPTLGPNGKVEKLNVNGQAASIELYFGEEILKGASKTLPSIQWSQYEPKMSRYQGAVGNKKDIQDRMRKALANIKSGKRSESEFDFSGIHLIFDSLVRAFN